MIFIYPGRIFIVEIDESHNQTKLGCFFMYSVIIDAVVDIT